ncbi:MAG: methyltransferase [Clostridia bacterium]|nr:methyltransferase [Clostridia bacterium]
MKLTPGERLEDLQCKGLKIIQNKDLYTFTSDSVVLANYVKTKSNTIAVEIGAGSGVISILVQAKNDIKKIYAFELQKEMAKLCQKNIKLNNLEDKICLFNANIKDFEEYLPKESADVVYSNPPYFKETNFEQDEVKRIAKEEICLSCKDLCEVASKLLKNGGTFYCCYSAERSVELICNLQKANLMVKEMFFTENGKGKTKLVLVKSVKGAKYGVKVLPNLVTNEESGDYLETLHTKNYLNNN